MSRNPAKLFFSGHHRITSGIKEAKGDLTIRWKSATFSESWQAIRIST